MKTSNLILIAAFTIAIFLAGCASTHNSQPVGPDDDEIEIGEMIFVPSGEFVMGSQIGSFGQDPDETPAHTVSLSGYYISAYEVTNSEYARFLSDSTGGQTHWNYQMEIVPEGSSFRPKIGKDDYPVRFVTWYDAVAYAEWIGGRLPSEAEWEKAARGPNDRRLFPWGDHISDGQANFANPSGLWEVGTALGRSYYGCWDMAGNIWEWTNDWYDGHYYSGSPYRDPPGPISGDEKSVRGGGYMNDEKLLRCSERLYYNPRGREMDLGFRCVIDSVAYAW